MNAMTAINAGNTAQERVGVRSKVIVLEHDKAMLGRLRDFIERNNLVGYQATEATILSVLKHSVDLGAIFLPCTDSRGSSLADLAIAIHGSRPELPIFLRTDADETGRDLEPGLRSVVAGIYQGSEAEQLKELVDTFLFNRHYPNEFVTSVKEFTLNAFKAAFKGLRIEVEPPYIVRDKIIFGELFSLLPLESNWCRGYMMLQSEESNVREAISVRKTQMNVIEPTFRHVNELLAELANMIWGSFKARYGFGSGHVPDRVRVEVPIIINHARKFISFGADDPQLCFRFTLTDPDGKVPPMVMYEKFIFSLDWSPERFAESNRSVNELVSSGELEMF